VSRVAAERVEAGSEGVEPAAVGVGERPKELNAHDGVA
jgi:hypothetical protein